MAQPVFMWTSHHTLRWDSRLVESQEGLETEVSPKADLLGTVRNSASHLSFRLRVFGSNLPRRAYVYVLSFLDSNRTNLLTGFINSYRKRGMVPLPDKTVDKPLTLDDWNREKRSKNQKLDWYQGYICDPK
ncbi:hypothetical protein M9H77_02751 [Catharanthus roseus]|uniref:Uncharacterized protein n=1 Tax=Catharanthus roseus TaxID=4058 RepID=A0ACC0C9S6_CATRO|nr:hypothetical protein M9H77_02751 [Catharanthus roseus]